MRQTFRDPKYSGVTVTADEEYPGVFVIRHRGVRFATVMQVGTTFVTDLGFELKTNENGYVETTVRRYGSLRSAALTAAQRHFIPEAWNEDGTFKPLSESRQHFAYMKKEVSV
jgi:hypothetical protein